MEHVIELVIGDSGGDGHSQTSTTVIRSNYNRTTVYDAFLKSAKKLKVYRNRYGAYLNFCNNYEDRRISLIDIERLEAAGLSDQLNFLDSVDRNEPYTDIDPDDYVAIWLAVAGLELPDFKWKRTYPDSHPINIGGYGLFSM